MMGTMSESQSVRTPSWMTLDTDERVLLRTGPSTNLLMAGIVAGFFLITFASFPFIALGAVDAGRRTTFAVTGLVVIGILYLYVRIRGREYAVTNKRVSVASGLRDKAVTSVDIENVDEVRLEQDRWRRLLSVGTLRFETDDDDLRFSLVGSPHFVYERALDFTQGSTTVAGVQSDRGSPM